MLRMSSSKAAYHHGDLAHALETAAMQLLAQKPANEIGLREVARAAGVSHNAPYHHFSDRNGLLKALAERSMAELVETVRAAVEKTSSPREGLHDGGVAYIRFAAEHPHAFDAVYDPTVCIPGSPTERMAPLIEELETLLAEGVVAAGLDRAEDAAAVWGTMHGLATLTTSGHLELGVSLAAYGAVIDRMIPEP